MGIVCDYHWRRIVWYCRHDSRITGILCDLYAYKRNNEQKIKRKTGRGKE